LQPYVQDAVDEIEYVTGNTSTTWGAQRAKDGHPDPFPLKYVEIGNEDQFDRAKTYDARFTQFYDAIKAKYPDLQIIATTPVQSRTPDVIDEHLYPSSEQEMENRAHEFDTRARTGPKIFVGEWATRVGRPTPDLAGALGDAAWMTGMERNSDLVIMGSYAPLFVNVSPGAMQWPTDLIGYDALTSYGSPSYYAQKIFSVNHGDVVLPTSSQNIPTRTWQPPARRGGQPPPPVQVPTLFFDATRNTQDGTIYLKIVNSAAAPQPVQIALNGVTSVAPTGDAVVLSSASLDDTNSIDEPTKVVPVTSATDGLGASFTRTFPPYSITILKIHAANSPAPGAAGG
jgi:alpha-N-arabinofuranosidase